MAFLRAFKPYPTFGLLILAAGACSFPTSPPLLEQRWVVAAPADSITLPELLPSAITIQNGEFRVAAVSGSVDADLGSLCGACAAVKGQTAPVPAFQGGTELTVELPLDVTSVTLGASDTLIIALTNGLGFDPLSAGSGGSGPGTLTLTATDAAGLVIAQLTPIGSLPTQTTTTYHLPLTAGQAISGPLSISLALQVQALGAVAIPFDAHLRLEASSSVLAGSAATVVVDSQAVDITTGSFEIDEISNADRSHILAGTLHLAVMNPFGISGAAMVRFELDGQEVIPAEPAVLSGGAEDSIAISFDASTMRALLAGGALRLHLTAVVSGTGPGRTASVRPADRIDLTPRIAFTTRIGG